MWTELAPYPATECGQPGAVLAALGESVLSGESNSLSLGLGGPWLSHPSLHGRYSNRRAC